MKKTIEILLRVVISIIATVTVFCTWEIFWSMPAKLFLAGIIVIPASILTAVVTQLSFKSAICTLLFLSFFAAGYQEANASRGQSRWVEELPPGYDKTYHRFRPRFRPKKSRVRRGRCESRCDFRNYASNRGRYEHIVREIARNYGFIGEENDLVAQQGGKESRFDPNAIGEDCERGIMQVKPGTAEMLGRDPDKLLGEENVRYSVETGIIYLRQLKDIFGTIDKALCAYNMGEGGLKSKLRRNPGFDPSAFKYVRAVREFDL